MKTTKEELRRLKPKLESDADTARLRDILLTLGEGLFVHTTFDEGIEKGLRKNWGCGMVSSKETWCLGHDSNISLDEFEKLALQTLSPGDVYLDIKTPEQAKEVVQILKEANQSIYAFSSILECTAKPGRYFLKGSGNTWLYSLTNSSNRKLITIDQLRTILGIEKEEEVLLPQLPISSYQVPISTDEEAVRMAKVLRYNKEPMVEGTALPSGDSGGKGLVVRLNKEVKSIYNGKWIYMGNNEDYTTITLQVFEKMFGEKKESTITETKQQQAKIMKITRRALGEIYLNVCSDWQGKIKDMIAAHLFVDEFEVSEELVLKAWSAADKTVQKEWLQKYLPKPEPKFKAGDWVFTGKNICGYGSHPNDINDKVVKIFSIDNDRVEFEQKGEVEYKNERLNTRLSAVQKYARLATPEEIEKAQWYPDGTPCFVRDNDYTNWGLAYSNGKGSFYGASKKTGVCYKWKQHQKLDINNLPVNE